uniref:Uncharacterized protein n=1 Tax=Panagrolaimus sp. PS1159 TaxID=55785 RepID=A0AC35GSG8_9BILA
MTAKDYSLPFKDKQAFNSDKSPSNGRYNNLNLNQKNQNSLNSLSEHSKNVSTEKGKSLNHGFVNDNFETQTKKDSHSWKKSTNNLSPNLGNNYASKDELQTKKNSNPSNSSKLSLYIKPFKNKVEAESDLNNGIHNMPEFPRQQENNKQKIPKVAQYRSKQQLHPGVKANHRKQHVIISTQDQFIHNIATKRGGELIKEWNEIQIPQKFPSLAFEQEEIRAAKFPDRLRKNRYRSIEMNDFQRILVGGNGYFHGNYVESNEGGKVIIKEKSAQYFPVERNTPLSLGEFEVRLKKLTETVYTVDKNERETVAVSHLEIRET